MILQEAEQSSAVLLKTVHGLNTGEGLAEKGLGIIYRIDLQFNFMSFAKLRRTSL